MSYVYYDLSKGYIDATGKYVIKNTFGVNTIPAPVVKSDKLKDVWNLFMPSFVYGIPSSIGINRTNVVDKLTVPYGNNVKPYSSDVAVSLGNNKLIQTTSDSVEKVSKDLQEVKNNVGDAINSIGEISKYLPYILGGIGILSIIAFLRK